MAGLWGCPRVGLLSCAHRSSASAAASSGRVRRGSAVLKLKALAVRRHAAPVRDLASCSLSITTLHMNLDRRAEPQTYMRGLLTACAGRSEQIRLPKQVDMKPEGRKAWTLG